MKLFDAEKLLVAQQTVLVGDALIFYVFDAFDSRSNSSDNAHLYEEAVESLSIGLPLDAKLSETSTILPPPLFGKPYVRKKDNPDLMRGRKRKTTAVRALQNPVVLKRTCQT
ncbi:hypothetical protein F443_09305 [Phytophthora nicotianae P1569]|uniref:Uncharacterized protein n=1 Tax=Phytophthora nicotianae P1569 TaxID=1317065 RepID=V9F430_PHYNI|nr:hypothetical protein F443_09305 [Phytophthora nicotianae P1569]